jgi:predicted RNA-binding Zn-ribbon protein involved in translation (DUF1610 family)
MADNGQLKINIDINSLPTFGCPECENQQWVPVFSLKAISRITSPVGQAGMMHVQTGFMCSNCGYSRSMKDLAQDCKELVEKDEVSKLILAPTVGGK